MSLKSHSIWNIAGTGLPMLIGLFSIPLLIGHLGLEAFGLLTIIWTIIGYFSLFDFGLGRALTQQISASRSQHNANLLNISVAGLTGTLVLGLMGGLLLFIGAKVLIYQLNVSQLLVEDAYAALILAALSIPMVTVTSGLRGILEGFENFKTSNLLRLLLGSLNFLLPVVVVLFIGSSLMLVVWSLVLSRLLVMLLHVFAVRGYFSHTAGKLAIRFSEMKKLFTFGLWMTISNLIGPLMVYGDRFFISSILGAGVVAFYTVPQDFVVRLLIIPAAISTALFPRLAYVHANEGTKQAMQLFRKGLKTTALIMAPICLLLGLLSFPGLELWLGEKFAHESWPVLSILAVGIFFNSLAHIPFAALQAAGMVRTTSLIHLVEFLIYFPLLILLLNSQGIMGAAIAWSVRTLLDFVALQYFALKNQRTYATI
ncbi:MAG: flippase [Bacteroidales bacterium]|nr:flippase [Bacteroidales bacterium]